MIPDNLDSIARRKAQLRADIQAKNKVMSGLVHDVFAPVAPATTRAGALVRHINTGMAMLDGFLFGLRVMRRMRTSFGKKKR